jgi:NTE family protein
MMLPLGHAQGTLTPQPAAAEHRRPKVALVLSGGGARGFAHVGVLRALQDEHVPIDVVVGTSMGAIVGGLFASGMDPDALERELLTVDWDGVFESRAPRQLLSNRRKEEDFELSPVLQLGFRDGEFRLPTGAVSTRSLEWLLRRYTLATRHLTDFDALPTPFRAVATDMETGEPVVLERGDLAAALRASMSVPGVFAPLEVDGRILGDGGLVDNLPVDVARSLGADVVIAVNIGTPLAGRDTLGSVLGVSAQMISILTEQNVQRSIASLTRNDLLLAPPLGKASSADFSSARDIVRMGHDYAEAVRESLKRFAVSEAEYDEWQLARQPLADATPKALAFVRFEGVDTHRAAQLQKHISTTAGEALDDATLQTDLRQLSASGDYARVDYHLDLDPVSMAEGLVIDLQENRWGPNYFRVGLDLSTDFKGSSDFNVRINHNRHWLTPSGTEWRNQVQIGQTVGMRSELYQPLGTERDRFILGYLAAQTTRVELFDAAGDASVLFRRSTQTVGLDHGWTVGRNGQLGDARIGLYASHMTSRPELVNSANYGQLNPLNWSDVGLRASLVSDQLDHANFPQSGQRSQLALAAGSRSSEGTREPFCRLDARLTGAATWGSHTLNAYAEFSRAPRIATGALDEYSLGGFQRLSGYRVGQVVGNTLAFARLGYYKRLDIQPGVARAVFAGGTAELGNAWLSGGSAGTSGLRTGFSLYLGADTGVGPIYLSLVHAPRGTSGIYFFIGRP